jgi:hypothetical protein
MSDALAADLIEEQVLEQELTLNQRHIKVVVGKWICRATTSKTERQWLPVNVCKIYSLVL